MSDCQNCWILGLSDCQTVDLSEMSDRLIGIVRMIRFRYTVENAIVRIIRLANWNAQEFWQAFLGPGFHSIEIFISLTLSAPQKAVKISYSKLLMIYA